ncbi:glycerophosphodiester phosphodiesterase [Actinomadura darangshiensis]|uniref:Glycerophosphodiester phosphodiesterase n=1 Tax=Actinomadura darangshiensis TaxID=705336 RepID=A0A4R5B698_9ACTN|nr:glycerophosphodiester phosphodiesterase family protein [Actinomadura darangshiensis]TDD80150.1 glycerophosphodiester phosphodiesterase [Actinomadura darangshiensis]
MHRRTRLAFIAVLATAALTVPATAADADPDPIFSLPLPGAPEPRPRAQQDADIVNVAHRGASAYAPENTLAAFRLAEAKQADMFELDVQETKDHQLVIMHDTTLDRTTDAEEVYPDRKPWKVGDFTLAEIEKLDAGSWFAKKYEDERVPTLGRVLSAMRGKGLGLLLEIKSPELYPGVEERIAAALRRSPSWLRYDPGERRLVVQSFDWESVRRFHDVLPKVPTGLLGTPKVADLPELAKYADQINPTYGDLTKAYVDKVHDARMDVLTWTLNDSADMEKAVGLGVDGIITNEPDVLRKVLERSGDRAA